jgi:hypothetical protein
VSSHASAEHARGDEALGSDLSANPALRESNVRLEGVGGLTTFFLLTALVGFGVVLASAFIGPGKLHAMASFQFAITGGLAICLGGLFFTLVMNLMAAGWFVTLRRQTENMAMQAPVLLVLAAIVPLIDFFGTGGLLYTWMNSEQAGSLLLEKKSGFLNVGFFALRLGIYFLLWAIIAGRVGGLSLQQDRTGNKWLTNKARFNSAWGMLVFALTTSFAGFDLLMSIDFRFFSTMWGVYYFAGSAFSAAATIAIIAGLLRRAGKLEGLVSEEHFHDTGKLCFTFTVFWAYIAFSQYFLIWYSNVPEETAWYFVRKQNGWQYVFYVLCLGHFIVPFLILLFRKVKRTPGLLMAVACWMLLMHFTDMFFIVRPMVTTRPNAGGLSPLDGLWVDIAAVVGVVGLLGFLFLRRMTVVPLIPIKDPRLPEALEHKNYV